MDSKTQTETIIRLNRNPKEFGATPDELDAEDFVSALPRQHSHAFFEDEQQGIFIGLWDTDDMIEMPGPYACDEFMQVLEGQVDIRDNNSGDFTTVTAGEAFVIPKGFDCQWQQHGYLRKFYFISEHPEESVPSFPAHAGVIVLSAVATQSAPEGGTLFPPGMVQHANEQIAYLDHRARFSAGTWQSEVFDTGSFTLTRHSLLSVVSGAITMTDNSGAEHEFLAGDAFFIPSKTRCSAKASGSVSINYAACEG
ncbi:MAG: cupin domain-containing protein [Pseudomonadales bacterium]